MLIDNDDKSIEETYNDGYHANDRGDGDYAFSGDCDDDGDDGLVMMMTQILGCQKKILLFPECSMPHHPAVCLVIYPDNDDGHAFPDHHDGYNLDDDFFHAIPLSNTKSQTNC